MMQTVNKLLVCKKHGMSYEKVFMKIFLLSPRPGKRKYVPIKEIIQPTG